MIAVPDPVLGRVVALPPTGGDLEELEVAGAVPIHSDTCPGVELDLVDGTGERRVTLRLRLSADHWRYLYPHLLPRTGRRGG